MPHTRDLIPPGLAPVPAKAGLPELGGVDFVLLHGRWQAAAQEAADALAAAILAGATAAPARRSVGVTPPDSSTTSRTAGVRPQSREKRAPLRCGLREVRERTSPVAKERTASSPPPRG